MYGLPCTLKHVSKSLICKLSQVGASHETFQVVLEEEMSHTGNTCSNSNTRSLIYSKFYFIA